MTKEELLFSLLVHKSCNEYVLVEITQTVQYVMGSKRSCTVSVSYQYYPSTDLCESTISALIKPQKYIKCEVFMHSSEGDLLFYATIYDTVCSTVRSTTLMMSTIMLIHNYFSL